MEYTSSMDCHKFLESWEELLPMLIFLSELMGRHYLRSATPVIVEDIVNIYSLNLFFQLNAVTQRINDCQVEI